MHAYADHSSQCSYCPSTTTIFGFLPAIKLVGTQPYYMNSTYIYIYVTNLVATQLYDVDNLF